MGTPLIDRIEAVKARRRAAMRADYACKGIDLSELHSALYGTATVAAEDAAYRAFATPREPA